MGLPLAQVKRKMEETLLADNVLEDSEIYQATQEHKRRNDTLKRIKLQNALGGHREKMDDSLLDKEENSIKAIPDLPSIEKNRNYTASDTECKRGLENFSIGTKIMNLPQMGPSYLRTSKDQFLIEDTLLKRDNVKNA